MARGGVLADVTLDTPFANAEHTQLILGQEMGLGKTLSVLALICSSLDMEYDQNTKANSAQKGATLVVTPKSSMCDIISAPRPLADEVKAIPGWREQIVRWVDSEVKKAQEFT